MHEKEIGIPVINVESDIEVIVTQRDPGKVKESVIDPEVGPLEIISTCERRAEVQRDIQADAILRGSVVSYLAFPILVDQATGRASGVQVNVTMQVSFVERASGTVIFTRPNFVVQQRYEIATVSNKAYFEEDDAALDRLSRDVARDVVSAILENF